LFGSEGRVVSEDVSGDVVDAVPRETRCGRRRILRSEPLDGAFRVVGGEELPGLTTRALALPVPLRARERSGLFPPDLELAANAVKPRMEGRLLFGVHHDDET
jgi:hypothetical protein